ncbi:MAG: hypothetical protein KBE65_16145 [Phycisphaerae bacterium]|nr:hypothetical protein [Phycisphaerae bacterium]
MASNSLAQAQAAENSQTVQLMPFHGPNVIGLIHYGNCQWLYPREGPDEKLISEPDYQSGRRVYYAARYGDAPDSVFTLVLDESRGTGTGHDTLYADLNNDNRITPENERFGFQLGTTRGAEPVRITLSVSAGGKTIPYAFDFTAFPYKDTDNPVERIHANCRDSTIMMGEATFGGKRCKVALADLDSNGLFNDYEQGVFRGDRFFVDLDENGSFSHARGLTESFSYARYTEIAGTWYALEASPDGGTLQIRTARPTFGTVKAPANVKSVGLSSPKQFQQLEFKDGQAKALAGTYEVRNIAMEIVDSNGARWTSRGRYGQAGPQVAIEPNHAATLASVLPLTIRVDVRQTSEPAVIELEPQIVDAFGGSFSTLRRNNSRHEPPAKLLVKDADGKQIAEANLEYG